MRGETIVLLKKTQIGVDGFGQKTYSIEEVEVSNVLIGTPSTDAVVSDLNIYGKKLLSVLGIPKGDTNNWKDVDILIRGEKFKTYGFPLTQTEENVPTYWNTQVKVEKYE